jgi:hypothetical protein
MVKVLASVVSRAIVFHPSMGGGTGTAQGATDTTGVATTTMTTPTPTIEGIPTIITMAIDMTIPTKEDESGHQHQHQRPSFLWLISN